MSACRRPSNLGRREFSYARVFTMQAANAFAGSCNERAACLLQPSKFGCRHTFKLSQVSPVILLLPIALEAVLTVPHKYSGTLFS